MRPTPTGSSTAPITIGIESVACLKATVGNQAANENVRLQSQQRGGQVWHALRVVPIQAAVNDEVLTFDPARVPQASVEGISLIGAHRRAAPREAHPRDSG